MLSSYQPLPSPAEPDVTRRLLLVEHDASTRAAMAYVLETSGYAVVRVADASAALAFLLRSHEHPELILLNVTHAGDFRWARTQSPEAAAVPVVIYATHPGPGADHGPPDAAAYLAHPFGHRDLLHVVERCCVLS